MATRVTFVSGTAEMKRRDRPRVEESMVASTSHVTGGRGNPYYTRRLAEMGSGAGMESVTPAQSVTYVDGKCSCCPYGYHIDLDFVNFCQDVADGSTLSNLKRIQRTKRNLRKSMEMMLHQQQQHGDTATASLATTPPPDVVGSTEASRLINMVQYEQSATHRVLRNIDSSVNATLASTVPRSKGVSPPRQQRYTSSDSEDGYGPASPVSMQPPQHSPRFNTLPTTSHGPAPPPRRSSLHHYHHPSNGDESSHFATSLSTSGRTDSMSSLSSVSTVSSEQVVGQYTSHASGMLNTQPQETATAQMKHRHEARQVTMTAERLASAMATHFPQGDGVDGRESPSFSSNTTIGKASLAAIREAMAVSLQRMRDLEEQVKAIPILQVRISVLKEEKRLLALQLKAKSGAGATVRSVGVGVDAAELSPMVTTLQAFPYPSVASPFSPLASSPRSPGGKSPTGMLVKSVGVGDHSVIEPYLLQPHLPTGYTIVDNQVQTVIRTTGQETLFAEGGERHLASMSLTSEHTQPLFSQHEMMETRSPTTPTHTHFTINQIQRSAPRPMTRSVGVGEGNVHDSSLQIHEKELRTVIIGGANGTVGKRNVGVEVRVPTRSVGVSYSCDDARPATRTIGVNVTCDTNVFTSLDFKGETELRTALRGVLQRSVRSVATSCSLEREVVERGVQHEAWGMVNVGCGGPDCRVDVDIRQPVTLRSVGVAAKPETSQRAISTDKDWVLERGTNTVSPETYNKACTTDNPRLTTVATNTQHMLNRMCGTQTDVLVFQSLQVIRNTGSNTIPTRTANSSCNTIPATTVHRGVNTKAPELVTENFDLDISFDSKTMNTSKEYRDTPVNTSARELRLSLTQVECVDVPGEDVEGADVAPRRPLTMQEHIIQRGANQASAFLGGASSSGSLSSQGSASQMEDATVTRTVKETVYTSPSSSHIVWGQGSEVRGTGQNQVDIVRSSSGGRVSGGDDLTAVSGQLGGGGGGGYSRSTVTRTITTSGGTGGRLVDDGGQSSTVTRRTIISGGGAGGRLGDDDGHSSTITKRTITTASGGVGSRFDTNMDSSDRTTTTTVINTGHVGSQFAADVGGGIQDGTVTKTIITSGDARGGIIGGSGTHETQTSRMVTSGGTMEAGFAGDSGGDSSQGSSVTRTVITSGGTGGQFVGGSGSSSSSSTQEFQTSRVVSTGGAMDAGFAGHFGGDASQGSTVTRTVVTSGGGRGGSSGDASFDAGGRNVHRSMVTRTITTGGGDVRSGFGGDEADATFDEDGRKIHRTTVTKTFTSRGGVGGRFGSDASDATLDGGSGGIQRSTVTRTVTTSGGGGGVEMIGDSSGSESVVKQAVMVRGRVDSSPSRSEVTVMPTLKPSRGLLVEEGYTDGKGIVVHGGLKGGSSYMERFGFGKTSKVSAGDKVMTQTVESSSLAGQGNTSGVEVVEGTAVLRSSITEPSVQGGQVRLVETSCQQTSASGSLPNMSSSGEGGATQSTVVKRVSSSSRLTKHRHSDGARLSRDLALEMKGGFSGRRVGSVEDFMPDNMRRFMNINTTGSASSSGGEGKLDRMVTKTMRTVTTKRMSKDGKGSSSVTTTVTNPDGSVTTTTNSDLDLEGQGLGKLSSAQLDLSQIAMEAAAGEDVSSDGQTAAEGGKMKDSGCYDSSMTTSESSSMQGVDMSSMGSLERREIKSIMKRTNSDSGNPKKGISFAESVVGGTGSSSEEGTESDDESTTSYDEGSYDGREGDITYQCRDDEAIAQGLPGAKMYDQNIRETYEVSEEMRQACSVLANYLVDSTTIQTKELNANQSVVQEEWFRVSSHKLSSVHQVEDYLSSINEISHRLLDFIVNLMDSNGNAAIHYCVSHCNFDIVGLLLDTEMCDVQRPNKAGYTPAMLTSLAHVQNEEHRDAISRLFAASNINAQAEQTGQTALMLATSQCRTDMVELLLQAGADCNLQDFDGSTALMCACEHGHTAILQLLLSQPDCDASIMDNENSTALSIAMEAGHKDIGVILYKHLNFSKTSGTGSLKKRKGPSSPTPRHTAR